MTLNELRDHLAETIYQTIGERDISVVLILEDDVSQAVATNVAEISMTIAYRFVQNMVTGHAEVTEYTFDPPQKH